MPRLLVLSCLNACVVARCGDQVVWRQANDGSGVVVARGERRSVLERPDAHGQLRPVAANIDQILIVVAVEPEPEVTPMDGPAPAEDGGVSPWLFGTLVGATAIAGGFAIAFGVDAQANVDDYEANPTREAYEAGRDRERRTNALIGVTGGLALTALITAFFTDWGGDDDTSVSVTASGTGAGFVVRGTL